MPVPRTVSLGEHTLTRIGLGTNRLTDENRAFLAAAVEAGIDFIDTAHLYTGGASERTIGAVLASLDRRPVVATKGGYHPGGGRPDRLRAEFEESLERLGVDRVDLYYLHRVDPETPLEESLAVLREYLEAGRIEQLGISKVTVEQIERAREVVPIAAVQNQYSLGEREHDPVIDYCEREGILFVPYYPLRGGEGPELDAVCERHGATPEQVKLAWLLHRSEVVVPIPGTRSLDHLRENLEALELELDGEDLARLDAAAG